MIKRPLMLATILVLVAAPLTAQAPTPQRVYAAHYQINYGDLPEWINSYHANSVPVLDALVQEGAITGYGMRTHNTGGEYNIRQVLQGTADTDFEAFWSAYLSRLQTRDAVAAERGNRMIQAHYDEIWNIDEVVVPEGAGGARFMYDSQFVINFADFTAWNDAFASVLRPSLQKAVDDGLLGGWVTESHNTGGRFNWKLILLIDEWDNIDDVHARFLAAAPPDHPMWRLFSAHRDELWEAVPPPGN